MKTFRVFLFIFVFLAGVFIGLKLKTGETVKSGFHGEFIADSAYYQVAKKLIKNARKRVWLIMFEAFDLNGPDPLDTLYTLLIEARKRGVNVKIILEGGEDFLGYRFKERIKRTAEKLKKGGLEVKFDRPGKTTHTKMLIVDDFVLLGSTNWTYYSFFRNHEADVLLEDGSVEKQAISYFGKLWSEGREVESRKVIKGNQKRAQKLSLIAKILKNPDEFDGRTLEIKGIVRGLKLKFSKRGRPYAVFYVEDENGNALKVYTRGHPSIEEGDMVKLKGVFYKVKKVGRYRFYNEFEASDIEKVIP